MLGRDCFFAEINDIGTVRPHHNFVEIGEVRGSQEHRNRYNCGAQFAGVVALFLGAEEMGLSSLGLYRPEGLNRYTIRQFLVPFEQTARLCGMRYLPPYIVHGMHRNSGTQMLDQYAGNYRTLLEGLRDGRFELDKLEALEYANDILSDPA